MNSLHVEFKARSIYPKSLKVSGSIILIDEYANKIFKYLCIFDQVINWRRDYKEFSVIRKEVQQNLAYCWSHNNQGPNRILISLENILVVPRFSDSFGTEKNVSLNHETQKRALKILMLVFLEIITLFTSQHLLISHSAKNWKFKDQNRHFKSSRPPQVILKRSWLIKRWIFWV